MTFCSPNQIKRNKGNSSRMGLWVKCLLWNNLFIQNEGSAVECLCESVVEIDECCSFQISLKRSVFKLTSQKFLLYLAKNDKYHGISMILNTKWGFNWTGLNLAKSFLTNWTPDRKWWLFSNLNLLLALSICLQSNCSLYSMMENWKNHEKLCFQIKGYSDQRNYVWEFWRVAGPHEYLTSKRRGMI
jgi:hypothetical protein